MLWSENVISIENTTREGQDLMMRRYPEAHPGFSEFSFSVDKKCQFSVYA